jgi:hypothetical protein
MALSKITVLPRTYIWFVVSGWLYDNKSRSGSIVWVLPKADCLFVKHKANGLAKVE